MLEEDEPIINYSTLRAEDSSLFRQWTAEVTEMRVLAVHDCRYVVDALKAEVRYLHRLQRLHRVAPCFDKQIEKQAPYAERCLKILSDIESDLRRFLDGEGR
jgi:hypothetical protein